MFRATSLGNPWRFSMVPPEKIELSEDSCSQSAKFR